MQVLPIHLYKVPLYQRYSTSCIGMWSSVHVHAVTTHRNLPTGVLYGSSRSVTNLE